MNYLALTGSLAEPVLDRAMELCSDDETARDAIFRGKIFQTLWL